MKNIKLLSKITVLAAFAFLLTYNFSMVVRADEAKNQETNESEISAEIKEDIPTEHVTLSSCLINGGNIEIKGKADGMPSGSESKFSADPNYYLLEMEPYEDNVYSHRFIASLPKDKKDIDFKISLNSGTAKDRLYNRFVICLWDGGKYVEVSNEIYITNPEVLSKNNDSYVTPITKKGLMLEFSEASDAFKLGVKNIIVNIPFNAIMGKGIDYEYDGTVYHFNKNVIESYDKLISSFSGKSINVSAVLINGFNEDAEDFFRPGTEKKDNVYYYNFNSSTKEGVNSIKALASFLAGRYSGKNSDYGKIQNWIIGNEINNQAWNYVGDMTLTEYEREYEKSFRVFYNAIKLGSANSRIFFSTDCYFNTEGNNKNRYNARDFIDCFARNVSTKGNIDWNLAYHPYAVPSNEPEFWDDAKTGLVNFTFNSPIVSFGNISVLTDYMKQDYMRNSKGEVRHIILSEGGFTSKSATRGEREDLQAASFAYAYYIIDSNPYIDAFILSRQIDAPSEVASSLALGLWKNNSDSDNKVIKGKQKYIWNVFKYIDSNKHTLETSEFAKKLIGIDKWSDVIPGFRWSKLEK